nr:unnamed protein product [Callosobruchus chinensis]
MNCDMVALLHPRYMKFHIAEPKMVL